MPLNSVLGLRKPTNVVCDVLGKALSMYHGNLLLPPENIEALRVRTSPLISRLSSFCGHRASISTIAFPCSEATWPREDSEASVPHALPTAAPVAVLSPPRKFRELQ